MLGSWIPKRWEMAMLLCSGCVISYTLRVNMSVAVSDMSSAIGMSVSDEGLALSAFYWGYTVGQIPASRVVQEYGSKWVFGLSVLLPSIVTLFVPAAAKQSYGLLLFVRFLIGLFEALVFPAVYQFIPVWIPLEEKTLMVPFIYSGMYIGCIVGFSVSSEMLTKSVLINGKEFGLWNGCFYIFGLLGIAWFPLWTAFAYESPDKHPNITQEEKDLISEGKHFVSSPGSIKELHANIVTGARERALSFSPMRTVEEGDREEDESEETSKREKENNNTQENNNNTEKTTENEKEGLIASTASKDAHETPTSSPKTTPKKKVGFASTVDANDVEVTTPDTRPRKVTFSEGSIKNRSFRGLSFLSTSSGGRSRRPTIDEYDHELSAPISIESLGFNMRSTASSKYARLDPQQSDLPPGRPRTLTIVREAELRKEMAARIPWKNFFTHPVSLTFFANCWMDGFINCSLLSMMPLFLSDAFGFDMQSASSLCVFPYLALFVSAIGFGVFFDLMQDHFDMSTDAVRKISGFICYGGASIGLIICAFMPDKNSGYALMIVTQFMLGAANTGINCAFSDVAPNYSSALNTVGNTICAVAGIVGPLIISAFTAAEPGVWGWRYAFFLVLGQGVIAVILWGIFQTSEIVPELNEPRKDPSDNVHLNPGSANNSPKHGLELSGNENKLKDDKEGTATADSQIC